VWGLGLRCGGLARIGGTSRRDYLRETEDILSYEPFLGVADPPQEAGGARGGVTSRLPRVEPGIQQGVVGGGGSSEPMFGGPIENVTVNVGREAVMECKVNNLRSYKVGWLKAGDQTILALHKRVITHNTRVSVSHEDSKIWKLHLRNVVEADRGCYMCQINTEQMKQQLGCLDVNVPPDIDYLQTSKDVVVQEGDNVTLTCRASGHPRPTITWRREDGSKIQRRGDWGGRKGGAEKVQGELLNIAKVGRGQMGAYLCIASNEVPPAVSKRISLNVNFAPEILVPQQLLGLPFGESVMAECLVEAYPNTINYWMKHQKEMLLNGGKYTVMEEKTKEYSTRMQLHIKDFQESDVGVYTCISTNSLGKSDGTIRLYEIPPAERATAAAPRATTLTQQIEIDLIESRRRGEEERQWLETEQGNGRGSRRGGRGKEGRGGRRREDGQENGDSKGNNNSKRRNFPSATGFSSSSPGRVGLSSFPFDLVTKTFSSLLPSLPLSHLLPSLPSFFNPGSLLLSLLILISSPLTTQPTL